MKPHQKQQWCISEITAEFLARMEDILHLYSLGYDPEYPVVCFDERPCLLHREVVAPLAMQPGRRVREHYEYERAGTCSLLVAFEPLRGYRLVEVSARRTAADYTRFMQRIAEQYPEARQIRLVQDNLNTHTAASFYKHLPAEEAFALAQRFDMHYTPKKGSWLNISEIELSVIARCCLERRIATQLQMGEEVYALADQRNAEQASVDWQFTPAIAREKLQRHYNKVNIDN